MKNAKHFVNFACPPNPPVAEKEGDLCAFSLLAEALAKVRRFNLI